MFKFTSVINILRSMKLIFSLKVNWLGFLLVQIV